MMSLNDMINGDLGHFTAHEYLNLETYRRTGLAVRTPVWFAQDSDCIFIRTIEDSGKVKRIRNNPHVRIAPCDSRGGVLGAWVEAEARLASAEEEGRAVGLLRSKYGKLMRGYDLISSLRGTLWTVIHITPNHRSDLEERK